jgi:hypothetical protein
MAEKIEALDLPWLFSCPEFPCLQFPFFLLFFPSIPSTIKMSFPFTTVISDSKTALSYMLFCKKSGITTVPEFTDFVSMSEAILDAILDRQITAGDYKALFGAATDLPEKILALQTERGNVVFLDAKKKAFFERKKTDAESEEMKALTNAMHQQFNNYDTVTSFLEKAKSNNPDAVCGCSSVSCLETHA